METPNVPAVRLDTTIRGHGVWIELDEGGVMDPGFVKTLIDEILSTLLEAEKQRRERGVDAWVQLNQEILDCAVEAIPKVGHSERVEDIVRRVREKFLTQEFLAFLECMVQHVAKDLTDKDQWCEIGKLEFQIELIVQPAGTYAKLKGRR